MTFLKDEYAMQWKMSVLSQVDKEKLKFHV